MCVKTDGATTKSCTIGHLQTNWCQAFNRAFCFRQALVYDRDGQPSLPLGRGAVAVVVAKGPKKLIEEGMFCSIFFGDGGILFLLGFWQKRWLERGFLVVKLWWIAGESWLVDGQDSGSKNVPLFRVYF